MDINTKLNLTFLIIALMGVLFIKVRSEMSGEPCLLIKASAVIFTLGSFAGFIVTCFIRIWL